MMPYSIALDCGSTGNSPGPSRGAPRRSGPGAFPMSIGFPPTGSPSSWSPRPLPCAAGLADPDLTRSLVLLPSADGSISGRSI